MKNKLIRISKIISHAGVCSRKDAEELIIKGKVKVNNKIFKDFFILIVKLSLLKLKINLFLGEPPEFGYLINQWDLSPLTKNSLNKKVYLG